MTSTHTLGPWNVTNVGWISSATTQQTICAIYAVKSGLDHAESNANAQLIAAAPDLLKALQDLFGADMEDLLMRDGKEDQIEAIYNAHAAIAKATGAAA